MCRKKGQKDQNKQLNTTQHLVHVEETWKKIVPVRRDLKLTSRNVMLWWSYTVLYSVWVCNNITGLLFFSWKWKVVLYWIHTTVIFKTVLLEKINKSFLFVFSYVLNKNKQKKFLPEHKFVGHMISLISIFIIGIFNTS